MTRALVTGATGFLGRYATDALSRTGRIVVPLTRTANATVGGIVCDLEHDSQPLLPGGFDEVYHLAGLAHTVPHTEGERKRFYAVNREGTRKLLGALAAGGVTPLSFVLISTVAVYGVDSGTGFDEETARAATDPYGASKKAAEDLVIEWCVSHGVRLSIVRLPLVIGRSAPGNLRAMARAIQSRKYFGIGDGAARRSIVYAADVAAILPAIAQTGGTFHLTDGRHPSFAQIEAAFARSLNCPTPMRLPLWTGRAAAGLCDGLEHVLQRSLPFSTRVFTKMTSSLTFSDEKARRLLRWQPSAALDHFVECV